MSLLQMSFLGAIFIIAVVIIRALAINKLPKKTFLILWEIVLLRLLIPFSIPSMLSVYPFISPHTPNNTFAGMQVDNIIPDIQEKPLELIGEFSQAYVNDVSSLSIWFVINMYDNSFCHISSK